MVYHYGILQSWSEVQVHIFFFSEKKNHFDRFVVLVCFCLVLFVGALTCRFETSVISTSGPAGCLDRHMSFGISGYLFSDCISSMERNHLGIFMIICMFWISPSASQEENC